MHTHFTTSLTSIAATAIFALAVGNASANRLSVSNHNFRAVWSQLRFAGGESAIAECPVTLEGSFHSNTIRKISNALMGFISRASVNSAGCASGHATVLVENLPWHLSYAAFTGTLPNITGIEIAIIGLATRIEQFGFFCLARATVERPSGGIISIVGGVAQSLTPNTRQIPATSAGGFGCPASEGGFAGEGTVTLLGNTTRITIRLI